MYNDRMYSVDYFSETSNYNPDDLYNDNWEYANSNFRYVPYTTLFGEMEHNLRADITQSAMGNSKDNLEFQANAREDFAIMIPAGAWHNIINTGDRPLKVYSIYAPPQHPHGVVHVTKPAE